MSFLVLLALAIVCLACIAGKNMKKLDRHARFCSLNSSQYLPSSYNSVALQHKTYLDVFTIVAKPEEWHYIAKGEFWLTYKLMKLKCHNRLEELRVHIFTDTQWIYDQGVEQGYNMYDMREMKMVDSHFMEMYKPNHHSINSVEYEYLCFYRWHLFRNAIESWKDKSKPIVNIMTVDSDVIILVNPFQYYFRTIETLGYNLRANNTTRKSEQNSFELSVVAPGAMQLWSAKGLIAYSDFIYDWYNKSSDVVEANTKQVAGYLYGRLHFSDMQMVEVFIDRNTRSRNGCYMEASLYNTHRRKADDQMLLDHLGCVPMARYNEFMKDYAFKVQNSTDLSGNRDATSAQFFGRDETLPFCFMHFQGDDAKPFMKLFLRYLLGLQQSHNSHPCYHHKAVHTQRNETSTMTTQRKNIRTAVNRRDCHPAVQAHLRDVMFLKGTREFPDIYMLQPDNTKRHLPDWDTFQSVVGDNITVQNIYPEILDLFPTGPPWPSVSQQR